METFPVSRGITSFEGGTMMMSQAPESHANIRAHQSIIDIQNPGASGAIASAGPSQNFAAYLAQQTALNPNYQQEMERNDFTVLPMDLQRYAANVGGDASQVTGSPKEGTGMLFPEVMLNYSDDFLDASTSLPHAAALHPTLPGPDRFRVTDAAEDANDYTANATDLSRYSAAIGEPGDSLPKQGVLGQFVRLPSQFGEKGDAAAAAAATSLKPITVERLGKRTSGSLDMLVPGGSGTPGGKEQSQPTSPTAAASASAAAGDGTAGNLNRTGSTTKSQHVTILAPNQEEEEEGATSGPLYGVRPIERSTSYANEGAGGEDEEGAGPMHFASSKSRQGAKSLKEISSLFSGDVDDEDEGGDADEVRGGGGARAGTPPPAPPSSSKQ
jgi:hypothetical protein